MSAARTWSDRPFGPITPLADVAVRGRQIASGTGQSLVIYESADHPGWLVKLFYPGFGEEQAKVLDRLVELPAEMSARDLALVDTALSWPITRVVDDGERTVGTIFAMAPDEFIAEHRLFTGETESSPRELDHLIQDEPGYFRTQGWPVPSWQERMRVARSLLEVATLFERHRIVYGDWSYANEFWARGSGRIFVIDVDGCGIDGRPWVESTYWGDPLAPSGTRLDIRTDRYKVSLGVLRCLTGLRTDDPCALRDALPEQLRPGLLADELVAALIEPLDRRPLVGGLLELIETELDRTAHPAPARPVSRPTPIAAPPPEPVQAYVPEPVETYVPEPAFEYVRDEKPRRRPLTFDQLLTPFLWCCGAVLAVLTVIGIATLLLS